MFHPWSKETIGDESAVGMSVLLDRWSCGCDLFFSRFHIQIVSSCGDLHVHMFLIVDWKCNVHGHILLLFVGRMGSFCSGFTVSPQSFSRLPSRSCSITIFTIVWPRENKKKRFASVTSRYHMRKFLGTASQGCWKTVRACQSNKRPHTTWNTSTSTVLRSGSRIWPPLTWRYSRKLFFAFSGGQTIGCV